jgi:hypothetical protein
MKGQALFEFIIFLPIMVILYLIMIILSGAINGSINQQKATRGYFYYLAKHNSFIPDRNDLDTMKRLSSVGMHMIGWKQEFIGSNIPLATCYKAAGSIIFRDELENCTKRALGGRSTYIRPYTVYGICGINYSLRYGSSLEYDYLPLGGVAARCSKLD